MIHNYKGIKSAYSPEELVQIRRDLIKENQLLKNQEAHVKKLIDELQSQKSRLLFQLKQLTNEVVDIDEVGGIHEGGCGWNPQGVFCGECSSLTCKDCINQYMLEDDVIKNGRNTNAKPKVKR